MEKVILKGLMCASFSPFFWSESSALADVMSSQESEEEPAAAAVKPQKKYYAVGGVTVNPP